MFASVAEKHPGGALGAALVALLLSASVPALAAAPSAKPRVYVLAFTGPAAPAVRSQVTASLKGKVFLLPKDKMLKAAARAKVPRPAIGKPKMLPKVIKAAKLAYVLKGTVKKGKAGLVLALTVVDSGGAEVWSGNLKVKAGKLVKAAKVTLATEVVPLITGAPADAGTDTPVADPVDPPPPVTDEPPDLPDMSGPIVDVDGDDGKKKKKKKKDKGDKTPREDDPTRPPVVIARVGGDVLFRGHRASSEAFVSNAADLCTGFLCFDVAPYYAITAELDAHPGSLTSSRVAAMFGLGARYTHGFLPSSYDLTDPVSGMASSVDISTGHRDLRIDVHAEFAFGENKWLPHVEPAIGFGWLDLGAGANPIDLRAMRYVYGFAGLRLLQPVYPPLAFLDLSGSYRLAFGVGSDAETGYGDAGGLAGTGYAIEAGVRVVPIKWIEVGAGWRFQRMRSTYTGVGESGFDGVKVTDAIHAIHVSAGLRIP